MDVAVQHREQAVDLARPPHDHDGLRFPFICYFMIMFFVFKDLCHFRCALLNALCYVSLCLYVCYV